MKPDSPFERLRDVASGTPGGFDETTLPPEAFEAWRTTGLRFGKYVLLGELGRGGTSVVYRAWQHDLRREVALKVVSGLNPELRERFLREARVGAGLKHPAVLPVFETGEAEGSLWLAMPLVKGKTLDELELDAAGAARCVAAAARGVQAAHEAGVVHRDLKPRNVMREDSGAVVVMDFGLALTREDSTRISVTGQVLGTPQYMAPEQAAGKTADARTDVYGLGATLYRMLAGRAPYECGTLQEFLTTIAARDPEPPSSGARVSRDLETIVLKAMDRDPARRYPTAAALADDLERFAAGQPVLGRRAPILVRAGRRVRRYSLALATVVLGAAIAGVIVTDTLRRKSQAPLPHPAIVRGRDFFKSGNYERAIAEFDAVPPGDDLYGEALKSAVEGRTKLRDWPGAAAGLAKYLVLHPEDAQAWRDRARCLHETGDDNGALADVDRALKLKPGSADFLLYRAQIRIARGEIDLAVADHDTAVEAEPGNAHVRANRAYLFVLLGRFTDAIRDFDAALELGGRQAELLKERGRAKFRALDNAGALQDLKEAVTLDPHLKMVCEKDIAAAEEALQKEKAQ